MNIIKELQLPAILIIFIVLMNTSVSTAQIVSNDNFSLGSYGRIGVGFSPEIPGNTGVPLNLQGQGSIGGRLEEQDYLELVGDYHFKPVNNSNDTTYINAQVLLSMFASGGPFIGNVSTASERGLVLRIPEFFVEAHNIVGSQWSAWVGSRYYRDDDVHIIDMYYFDDHSSQGFGVSRNNTALSFIFPAIRDSSANYPPYSFVTTVNGTPTQSVRQRFIGIAEHSINLQNGNVIELLGEWHRLANAKGDSMCYPGDGGWVAGIKYNKDLNTAKAGSFNQFSVRYGRGIANGGDGGSTRTWLTYGAPDEQTKEFNNAYSISVVEHFLLNLSDRFSLNGYSLFRKSKGAADSDNKAPDYLGRPIYNRKTDFAVGFRTFVYLTDWFHLLNEAHYTVRKDGEQPSATMFKVSIAPTVVPTARRSPWARPHLRLVFSAARYNDFAKDNLYSPFLQRSGQQQWGIYGGVKTEWWIY
ncbi:carbohydrate porin [Pontibacter silvestris]|uniref:Carbohydrate porin n=1 Tax=Pontibacter silvestris TaxID=2305183 RepID=A0ABW4WYX9_9BACT|nr:carbohydrate porin [Pontibacter silvestris]MCC9137394.1 carbohydrate porin [Pontibacter silvestris]